MFNSNFLLICGSNLKNQFSQNYIATEFVEEWLKKNYESSITTIFFSDFQDIPFIDNELLEVKYYPIALHEIFDAISDNTNLIFIVPEHNSNFPANFKNIFDWLSIKKRHLLRNKTVILISASETTKKERGLEITGKITFGAVGCNDYHFINWKGEESVKHLEEILKKTQ